MRAVKNQQTLRLLIILGISLVTTLALIGGMTVFHPQSFATFANAAHAVTLMSPETCATTKGIQSALCEHQDPIQQGCTADAETLDLQTVFQDSQQTKPLGEVELRFSPICKAYWIRTIAFITAKGVFGAIHARIVFHNQTKEDIIGTPTFPDPRFAYVAWTDMTTAPMLPHAGSGGFDTIGQPQPLIVLLKE